ncbi:MAG: hemerythrin domain-containing protein [Sulfitobacter sp.]|nr:hemerythrin domain-containing protein [Sulfitobacter sp.]
MSTNHQETSLALDLRRGLPDALRVLLAEYPRTGWEGDPGYTGLIQFWLDRHMMFRRILEALQERTEGLRDGKLDPVRFRQQLARLGGTFVQELHGHHSIEDMHYFPILAQKDSRIADGFALLDRDHHALDGHLNRFVEKVNDALQAKDTDKRAFGRFHEELNHLDRLLDRHLIDEEELVVPVILKYGANGLA